MSKDLPFFKFYPTEWMMGRIQRQSPEIQLAFIRLMCVYWHNECDLSYEEAELEIGKDLVNELKTTKIITERGDGTVGIGFLDEQMASIQDTSDKNRKAAVLRWDKERNAGACERNASAMPNDADKKKIRKEEDKTYFAHKELNEAFLSYIKHRKEIKKPIGEEGIKRSIKKLQKYKEPTAIQMIDESISNGWQGLFEIKKQSNGKERVKYKDLKPEDQLRYRGGKEFFKGMNGY